MIRSIGRTELRVVLAIVVTAVVPLLAATWLANQVVQTMANTAFQPEFGEHMDRSLGVYADLVKSMKKAMRHEGALIASRQDLRDAAHAEDNAPLDAAMTKALAAHPTVLSLEVQTPDGDRLSLKQRQRPIDETRERSFTVTSPLAESDEAAQLIAVFAADRRRLDEMEGAQEFAQSYKAFANEHRAELVESPYLSAFALLLGITVALAILVGVLVVRPVIRRINQLAAATAPVAEGDLSVRVEESGKDEIAELARAFNAMLERLGKSRARIEFLKRVGEWQNMAKRLAHEIKNPLTPIQLAVEECHGRYKGDDKPFRTLLDTTHDIVVEEVASLRRLVGEFAEFARLPRAALREGDLVAFLSEQEPRLRREAIPQHGDAEAVELELSVSDKGIPVAIDRTMLYRVLSNLVANGAQAALAEHGAGDAAVRVSAKSSKNHCSITVEDNGPGIDARMRATVFDPYVTTKKDGTGLGLTIVKKVIIDHGGQIDVDESDLGGARFRIRLPLWGTSASEAALTQSRAAAIS